jgi:phospholipid-binding lipoprotein MlaA
MIKLFLFLLAILTLPIVPDSVHARTHDWFYIEYDKPEKGAQVSDIYKPQEQGEVEKQWIQVVSDKTEDDVRHGVIGEHVEKEAEGEKPQKLISSEPFDEEAVKEHTEETTDEQERQKETKKELIDEEDSDKQTSEEDKKGEVTEESEEKENSAGFEEDEYLDDEFEAELDEELEEATIWDPISPFNYGMFVINDKLYFWFFKPLAQGWSFIIPELGRIGIQNVFNNVSFPLRFFNNLFQGKVKRSGIELSRFLINTTVGVVGIWDPAKRLFGLQPYIEDFGQTLGVWGMGHGFYLTCPLVGPLTVRDGLGKIPDTVLDPLTFIPFVGWVKQINETSLKIGDYEALKEASLDPYIAVRNAYVQHRNALTAE